MTADKSGAATSVVTAVVLAGGRGRRMGGVDKGLVLLGGRPLIEHVIDAVRPQVARVLISANRNRAAYERYGFPVVSDTVPDFAGPLAGLYTAWDLVQTPWVITVPCDTPAIPAQLAQRLLEAALREDAEVALAHDGQRSQPTFLLVSAALRDSVGAFLAGGGRKIDAWTSMHREIQVDFSDCPETFVNINTPEQLRDMDPLVDSTAQGDRETGRLRHS
jgi:molybdenum cofactor guanylyltransferase